MLLPKTRCPFCGAALLELAKNWFSHPEIGQSGYHTACYLIGDPVDLQTLEKVRKALKAQPMEKFILFAYGNRKP